MGAGLNILLGMLGFGRLLDLFSLCENACAVQSSGLLSLGVVCTYMVRVEHGQRVLAEPRQCRSMACGVSQMETRSRGCCTRVGTSQCPLPAASSWAQEELGGLAFLGRGIQERDNRHLTVHWG